MPLCPLTVSLPNAQNILVAQAVLRWVQQHEDFSSLSDG
jgi:trans-aconitate methyltransferase